MNLKEREKQVFERISKYLKSENQRLSDEWMQWTNKKSNKVVELKEEHTKVEDQIKVAKERLKRVKEGLEIEKAESKAFEEEVMSQIRQNEEKSMHQKQVDARMMLIQKTYEEWLEKNPPKKKKKKGGKKK